MTKPFTYENVRVVVGPRSYINEVLGEDIRNHAVYLIDINGTLWVMHSRLSALILCTDEDVPWPS